MSDNKIHHIGDGFNKHNKLYKFQSLVEGPVYLKNFTLSHSGEYFESAKFSMEYRFVDDEENKVYLNDVEIISSIPPLSGEAFTYIEVDVDVKLLKKDTNQFKIESFEDIEGLYDDFEFRNATFDFQTKTTGVTGITADNLKPCCVGPGGDQRVEDLLSNSIDISVDTEVVDDCGNIIKGDGTTVAVTGGDGILNTDGDVFTNPSVKVQGGRQATDPGDNAAIRRLAPTVETRDTDSGDVDSIWGGW